MSMEQKHKILVVDDEASLCEIIAFNLHTAGFDTTVAHSGEDAIAALEQARFDLVLLDVMMGEVSGFDVARHIKGTEQLSRTPIIFLTAKDTENDILTGFDLGADDYISKPFRVRELIARCQAVLRRSEPAAAPGNLVIDDQRKLLVVDGAEIVLGPTEYAILSLLAGNPGRVYSRQELIDRAWPHNVVVMDNTVNVLINRLRHKMGPYARHIVARPGFGYLFEQ